MPPFQNRVKYVDGTQITADFRSRRIQLKLNLVVRTQSASVVSAAAAAAIVAGVGAALRGAVGVALERVGPASHRAGESRAVDALRDSIAGAVLVMMMMVTHVLHIAIASGWPEIESPLTNQISFASSLYLAQNAVVLSLPRRLFCSEVNRKFSLVFFFAFLFFLIFVLLYFSLSGANRIESFY